MSQPLQTLSLNGKLGPLELLACLPGHTPAHPVARPPLLFVHGAFSGAWIWGDHFLPWLARAGHPAYALSLSGHGNSAGREQIEWLSIANYVDDLEVAVNWLQQQTGQMPVLIGHSMGGFVIQKLLEQGHQVPGVALLCSVPPQGLLAAQFHMLMRKPGLFLEINRLMSGQLNDLEIIREALFAQPVDTATLQRFFLNMQPESQRAIWDMSSLFTLPRLNNACLPPLLVLGAEEDALVPAFLVRSTARTYGVEARIFPGFGHGITHERDWPQIAAALLGWLEALPHPAAATA